MKILRSKLRRIFDPQGRDRNHNSLAYPAASCEECARCRIQWAVPSDPDVVTENVGLCRAFRPDFSIGLCRKDRSPFKSTSPPGVHQRANIYELLAGRTYDPRGSKLCRRSAAKAGAAAAGHRGSDGGRCNVRGKRAPAPPLLRGRARRERPALRSFFRDGPVVFPHHFSSIQTSLIKRGVHLTFSITSIASAFPKKFHDGRNPIRE